MRKPGRRACTLLYAGKIKWYGWYCRIPAGIVLVGKLPKALRINKQGDGQFGDVQFTAVQNHKRFETLEKIINLYKNKKPVDSVSFQKLRKVKGDHPLFFVNNNFLNDIAAMENNLNLGAGLHKSNKLECLLYGDNMPMVVEGNMTHIVMPLQRQGK